MRNKLDHARGWLLKAESDLRTARKMLEGEGPYDTACFHAQQAAEKYLKALLAYQDLPIPSTHNLEELEDLILRSAPGWTSAGVDLTELTPFAVQLRYDFDFWPERETGVQAVDDAARVRDSVLAVLPAQAHP